LRREKPFETPAVISGFWPIKDEIDIRPLMIELFNSGCQLALPVVQGRAKPLLFRAWRPGDPLEAGVFGTLQPSARRETLEPDALIVPMLACDEQGQQGFDRPARLRATAPRWREQFLHHLHRGAQDRDAKTSLEVEPGVTAGDFLQGFYLRTRDALSEKNRTSVTITLPDVSPRSIGMLIALYERVVGLYGLTHRESTRIISLESKRGRSGWRRDRVGTQTRRRAQGRARKIVHRRGTRRRAGSPDSTEIAFKILEHLAANKGSGVKKRTKTPWFNSTYRAG